MKVLVLGGTRFFGKYMVERLIAEGVAVTIATRGIAKDSFGNKVERLYVDRLDRDSLADVLSGKTFDIVYDMLAYGSADVRDLLTVITPKRYVMVSTVSVYEPMGPDTKEEDFRAGEYPLKWYHRAEAPYAETKRQAEAALYQVYRHVNSAAVRFPFVIGKDDYTKRLHFYIEHVVKEIPMEIDNLQEQMSFIFAEDAAAFLVWLGMSDFCGPINGADAGTVSLEEIIRYTEERTGRKAVLQEGADAAPYNKVMSYSINTELAERLGYRFPALQDKLWKLADDLIAFYTEMQGV